MARVDPTPDHSPGVLVRLVGELAVHRQGEALPAPKIGNRSARRLLALLAVQPGRTVAVDWIVDVLWGADSVPRDPPANVATLVSRLRARLSADAVHGDRRKGYRLGSQVRVDLQESDDAIRTAEAILARQPSSAWSLADRVMRLFEGTRVLADEPRSDWAEPARRLQGQILHRARHIAGTAALVLGDSAAAIAAGRAALAADRFDEAAHRLLMCAYHFSHETGRAMLTYERLRTTLAREFGADPARATRELHVAILRNAPLSARAALGLLRPTAPLAADR